MSTPQVAEIIAAAKDLMERFRDPGCQSDWNFARECEYCGEAYDYVRGDSEFKRLEEAIDAFEREEKLCLIEALNQTRYQGAP